MRMILGVVVLLGVGVVCLMYSASYTVAEAPQEEPRTVIDLHAAVPEVSARAWGIYDTDTGLQLIAQNAQDAYPIASVTKLMTALVAHDTFDLDISTTLSRQAVATEGRAGGLAIGEEISLRELVFPLLIESSNDAAEALAEYADRDVFLAAMNTHARGIGMTATSYADPSGLSPQNVSTVDDLARLVSYLASAEPHLLDITQLKEYIGTEHTWRNNNIASYLDTFQGGKHGYTDEAKRTLAARFREVLATGTEREVTIVLLGSDDLAVDIAALRSFVQTHVRYE